jgi:hypothetical protein
MDSGTKKVILVVILGAAILGLVFLAPALFSSDSLVGESDFDRQYRENLERSRQDGTANYPASGAEGTQSP